MIGKSTRELAAMIAAGGVSCRDITEGALRACDATSNIMTLVTSERARREAVDVDRRLTCQQVQGALDGIPIVFKDLFDLAGEVTTAGSRILSNAPPAHKDAAIVRQLAAAGAITIGRTNMTEFAFSGLGINPHFGTPAIVDEKGVLHIPGGSSSGAAAAVASGIAPLSVGSDTSGSIRVPAAFWGLVGYKASAGRYSLDGAFPLAASLDSIGFIGRTVDDVAFIDGVLSRGTGPSSSITLAELRILVPEELVLDQLNPAVAAAFEWSLSRLREAGARVERIAVPEIEQMFTLQANHGSLVGMEAYRLHMRRLEQRGPELDPRVAGRLLQSADGSEADYLYVKRVRRSLVAKAKAYFSAGAVIACPTVACTAPLMAPMIDDAIYYATNARVLRNTMVANFLDWCSITLPCGRDENGLAIGFMMARGNGEDLALLRAAHLVEDVISNLPGTP